MMGGVPIVTFHLAEGQFSTEQAGRLLARGSALYSDVLDAPIERVRAFVRHYPPELAAVAGELVAVNGLRAPYFELVVFEGRPIEQRHALLRMFTDLLVDVLGVDRELVRGRVIRVNPDDWGIAGQPASASRKAEIDARARASAGVGS